MTHSSGLRPCSSTHNRYIVSLKDRLQTEENLDFLKEDGFRHLETFQFPQDSFPGLEGDMLLVEAPDDLQASQAIEELQDNPRVEFAEFDQEFELATLVSDSQSDASPNSEHPQNSTREPDDLKRSLWGLENMDAPEAWTKSVGRRGGGPIIAVLDTGVDVEHTDLKGNIWVNTSEIPNNGKDDDGNGVVDDFHGYDAYYKDGNPEDVDGHGTHCAGTIGAVGNNGRGIVGVNWEARIMPIKIFNNNEKPRTSTSAILRGISYAGRHGARITSNSWGGGGSSRSQRRAFGNSRAFHLMAAGNDSKDNDKKSYYPAGYNISNSLAVASITRRGNLSSFSNYGKESVDVAAPGTSIYSTVPNNRYGYKSGTSMATPHVAGLAGLLVSYKPNLSNEEIKSAILEGVDPRSSLADKVSTGGSVNANRTLAQVAHK